MSQEDLSPWEQEAFALEKDDILRIGMPVETFFVEADRVALAFSKYWLPVLKKKRPGLSLVESTLPRDTGDEVDSLVSITRPIQTNIMFEPMDTSDKKQLIERASFLISEIGQACEYILDDDTIESTDGALAEAKKRMSDGNNFATLVQALVDHSVIADGLRNRLAELGDFDLALIDEAKELVSKLSKTESRVGREASEEIELRNRLCTLISIRVNKIRRAAKYVFRKHPKIVKKFTSDYRRKKRMEARRKKLKNKPNYNNEVPPL